MMKKTMCRLSVVATVLTALALSCAASARDAASPADEAPARTAPPETILFESSVGDVHFPHKTHLKMRCNRCHHQIRATALETPHDDYLESSWVRCRTCHDEDPAPGGQHYRCGECHHSELENIADETLSAKVVVHKSCWKCHKTSTGVGASENCAFCHAKTDNGVHGTATAE